MAYENWIIVGKNVKKWLTEMIQIWILDFKDGLKRLMDS